MAWKIWLRVEADDGTITTVAADQRDFVVFEGIAHVSLSQGEAEQPATMRRILAWSAMRRAGLIDKKTTRDKWDETAAEVTVTDDPDGPDEPPVPGRPEATAETASSSPSRAVKASGRSASGGKTRTS